MLSSHTPPCRIPTGGGVLAAPRGISQGLQHPAPTSRRSPHSTPGNSTDLTHLLAPHFRRNPELRGEQETLLETSHKAKSWEETGKKRFGDSPPA